MQYDIPFEQTTLITLLTNLKYELKRSISIEDLIKARDILLKQAIDDYNTGNVQVFKSDDWKGKVTFKEIDIEKELITFVEKYNKFITYNDDKLILNNNITTSELEEIVNKLNISTRIICASNSKKYLESLNLKTIPKMINILNNLEKRIEDGYINYMKDEENKNIEKSLKLKLFERFVLINNYSLLDDSIIELLVDYSRTCSCDNDNYEYNNFPINEEHYYDSEYFDDEFSLSDELYELNLYAIFGSGRINCQKVYEELESIFYREYNKKFEEEFEEILKEDIIINYFDDDYNLFSITYVQMINDFMDRYGDYDILNFSKYRLLYVIDNPCFQLYNIDNYNEIMKYVDMIKLKNREVFYDDEYIIEKPLECYKNEAKYFITSCFEEKFNEYTIRKLLFIATYYELTLDDDIVELLSKYKNYANYDFYESVIYNKDMGYDKQIKKN